MSVRNDPLLQAILANPEDDALRLVYSDWLDEHGDTLRAEFIRLQCEMVRRGTSARRRQECLHRANDLLHQSSKWLGSLRQLVVSDFSGPPRFERGFVASVAVRSAVLLEHQETILGQHPIQQLTLYLDDPEHFPRLVTSPYLARLTSLCVYAVPESNPRRPPRHPLGTAGAQALAQAQHLHRLQVLLLNWNQIADDGFIALANAFHLSGLQRLEIESNQLGPAALAVLGRTTHWKKLRALSLARNDPGSEGIRSLLGWPGLKHIQILDLGYLGIDAEQVNTLAASTRLSRLTTLDLSGNPLTDTGLQLLAASASLSRLHALGLCSTQITQKGVQALANSAHLPQLRVISVEGNEALQTPFYDWASVEPDAVVVTDQTLRQLKRLFHSRRVNVEGYFNGRDSLRQ